MSTEKRFIMGNKSKYIPKKKKNRNIRKKPVVKPYCPPLMQRYDGGVNGYATLWWCIECLKVCLTDTAATRHSIACRKKLAEIRKTQAIIPPTPE